jgi:hypothetical protein
MSLAHSPVMVLAVAGWAGDVGPTLLPQRLTGRGLLQQTLHLTPSPSLTSTIPLALLSLYPSSTSLPPRVQAMATRLRPRPRPSKPTATQRAEQETLIEHEPQQKQQAAAKAAVIPAATMITAKQSTEMLQTAMHAALSALAYLRNWFPVHCFDDIIYMSADAHWSYRDYASGEVEPSTLASSHRTPMRVMRRGRSTRVDQLLDWLVSVVCHFMLSRRPICLVGKRRV